MFLRLGLPVADAERVVDVVEVHARLGVALEAPEAVICVGRRNGTFAARLQLPSQIVALAEAAVLAELMFVVVRGFPREVHCT